MAKKLRLMQAKDLDSVLAWRNHVKVRSVMYKSDIIRIEEHIAWFEACQKDSNRELLIFEVDGKPLGFVNLSQMRFHGVFEWGFYVAPDAPPGSGTSMAAILFEHLFIQKRAHKLYGEVIGTNTPSRRFHEKLGFSLEGKLEEHVLVGESYQDIYLYGMLSQQWERNRKLSNE